MNEKLAELITKSKAKRKAYRAALKKFEPWQLEDVEYAEMVDADSALANWVIKNADKFRSVE